MHPGLHPHQPRTVQRKTVGGGEQHFKEDKQIEKIAGQESTVQPHQQKLHERQEMAASPLPARQGVDQRGKAQCGGERQHDRRQPVGNQHDAEGRRPVAQRIDGDTASRLGVGLKQQHHRHCQLPPQGKQRNERPSPVPLFLEKQQERPGHHRDEDGKNGQVSHRSVPSLPALLMTPPPHPHGRCRSDHVKPAGPPGTGLSWQSR